MANNSSPIQPTQPLQPYWLRRWCCVKHGWFETRTRDKSHIVCPECGGDVLLVEACHGMTRDKLPFVSKPRILLEPEMSKWQMSYSKGITGRARLNPKSLRSGKSTGRPRKHPKPPTTRTKRRR